MQEGRLVDCPARFALQMSFVDVEHADGQQRDIPRLSLSNSKRESAHTGGNFWFEPYCRRINKTLSRTALEKLLLYESKVSADSR